MTAKHFWTGPKAWTYKDEEYSFGDAMPKDMPAEDVEFFKKLGFIDTAEAANDRDEEE